MPGSPVVTAGPRRPRGASASPAPVGRGRIVGAAAALGALLVVLLVVSLWHLTQGTSGVGIGDLLRLLTGQEPADPGQVAVRDIVLSSRVPRLAAGLAVGFALGVAGALFQSVARNALASPDTLAVTAGAYLAVVVVAAFGLAVPLWASGATAFVGGLLAAALVMALAGGARASTTRLVLAGSAVAMALGSLTALLLILHEQETLGLFAWGNGSLSQLGLRAFEQAAPVVLVATLAGLLLSRRLDLLALGDDTAGVLGVPIRRTRALGTILAVLLTAAAVTLAGPIGFVGLCAPAIARLIGRFVPAMHRHGVLLPASGLLGALVVIGSDVAMRAALGAQEAIFIPTGVTTTLLGAVVLVVLARRLRDAGPTRQPPAAGVRVRSRGRFMLVLVLGLVLVAGSVLLGLLAGHTWLKTGDIALWLRDEGLPIVRFALDERAPRVVAAVLAGAGLALAGTLVQATCRNPLAEPGLLGITGGAGLGAVIVVTGGVDTTTSMILAATAGALLTFAVVYGLSWRGGLDSDRLVLVGIGVSAVAGALTTLLLVRADPWDTPRIFTWLSGTTYGRSWSQLAPIVVVLVVVVPLSLVIRRELDLLAVDEDTPRLAGIGLEPFRLLVLASSAVLSAACVSAVGVVGFVGLIAPHAARGLVGGRHLRVLPVAALLGAVLLGVADTLGRTMIAPAQIPAGVIVALLGAPYFVYLLARSRA